MAEEGGEGDRRVPPTKDHYFEAYANLGIHETMLKDEVRTRTYYHSMHFNKHLFKGKIVLDIGCGTGILSLFAAEAGAAMVIGVDNSDIVHHARNIVRLNLKDDVITIIKGKVEEVELPEGIDKVDIIVSEWMGHCLFYECMLDTVLFARDKWLKPGGLMFPDKVKLYIFGIDDVERKEYRIDFWKNVHGKYDMSCLGKAHLSKPMIAFVDTDTIITEMKTELIDIDLNTMKKEEANNFSVPFSLNVTETGYIHAFGTYFEVDFSPCYKTVWFSTSPNAPCTHWRQVSFFMEEPLTVKKGEVVTGQFTLQNDPRLNRGLKFTIQVDFDGDISQVHEKFTYTNRD